MTTSRARYSSEQGPEQVPPAQYDEDSMSEDLDEENTRKSGIFHKTLKNSRNKTTDTIQNIKGMMGKHTQPLCSACKEIPLEKCLPKELVNECAAQEDSGRNRSELVFCKSLSTVLRNREWCKLCRLLFRSVCQPENDLFKADHIITPLKDSDKLKNIKTFPEWVEKFPYWKRDWVGGADVWPFGDAVDRRQAAKSTLHQAKELFSQAEERDINTKSQNDIDNMYKNDDLTKTLEAANLGISLMNISGNQTSQDAQRFLASAQLASSKLALLSSKRQKRLPCIFVIRAYRKNEEKAGVLSVRVYGHGRAPLAALKEICHFSLRFEGIGSPRMVKEQIWYGKTLAPTVDVDFFRFCNHACKSLHPDCGTFQWSIQQKVVESYQCYPFRLIDVQEMRIVETDFEQIIQPEPHRYHLDYVALSYTWGVTPLPEGWIIQSNGTDIVYFNVWSQQTTSTRPENPEFRTPTRLTAKNRNRLVNKIDFESDEMYIPATIRDAIKIVQESGQRYLWVDSLCLIQEGDELDKQANIARMGRIYNHALFTIVAGDSPHADAGIKGISIPRDPYEQILEPELIGNAQLFLPVSVNLDFRPWEDRAWCFQEKMLSKRLLVFAAGFAVWHCRGGVWREDVNALDGDKSSVSFPWLRLTSIKPLPGTDIAQMGLRSRREDESIRLVRLPSMDQYIEAVEDFSRRTIGRGWEILDAFHGLQSVLGCTELLDSSFRHGLPTKFLDVTLLWHSRTALRRRHDQFDDNGKVIRHSPPSWTWAGWETTQQSESCGAVGAPVYYDKPFDIQADDLGIVKRLNKLGEERIRPRKGTFYGLSANTQKLMDFGLFSPRNMAAKGFKDWDSWQERLVPRPRVDLSSLNLDERHLLVQTEVATIYLTMEVWKTTSYTTLDGHDYCRQKFGARPSAASIESEGLCEVSRQYVIGTRTTKNVGFVRLDADRYSRASMEAIILSEAQYLGNETTLDVLGYPLYNIMLIERKNQGQFAERIGIGKIYKYAWRNANPRSEMVILE